MSDRTDGLSRAKTLQETIKSDPTAVMSVVDELLELAHSDTSIIQRTAIDALGVGLQNRPEAGVSELDTLIQTTLDSTVPCPNRWQGGLVAVTDAAPETACDAVVNGFGNVEPDQRGDTGTICVARILEQLAVETPVSLAGSMGAVRRISRTVSPDAQAHLFGAHLALVDTHREAVRPVLSDLLSAFETADSDTRRVAADILCALATYPDDGPVIVTELIHWLAAHTCTPNENRRRVDPRDSLMTPTLTDTPPDGVLGVTQILARIAEETPAAVAPYAADIASSLATWESTPMDQQPRRHLARALAAVARQRPQSLDVTIANVRTLLADDSEFVRYWATQVLRVLFPHRPDAVSAPILTDRLTDSNPDVRTLAANLTTECVAKGMVETDAVVTDLLAAHQEDNHLRPRKVFSLLESLAHHDPEAIRPALPVVEQALAETLTMSDAAAVFEVIAEQDSSAVDAVSDAVPALVDCLFTDSLTTQSAAAETLATIGTEYPTLLDDQLPVLLTVLERDTAGIDAIGDVLVTVGDRPVGDGQTVFEYIRDRSDCESATGRRTAARLLGAFVEAGAGDTDAAVRTLTDRLGDDDEQVREEALDALAEYVATRLAPDLVRSLYRTDTDHWRDLSADLFARATLLDASWVSTEMQRWLADRLGETEGRPRRLFVKAAGYVCGQIDAIDELAVALAACLNDDSVTEEAFTAVRGVVTEGTTTMPPAELVPAVERTLLDEDRSVSSACLSVLSHLNNDLTTPQAIADRLLDCLTDGQKNVGCLAEALVGLCGGDVTVPREDIVAALEQYATTERLTTQDWTCQNFGRLLREPGGGTALREAFVPLAADGSPDQRTTAFRVLASAANVWPAGVRPAAETLRGGVRADDKRVRGPALAALVAVGREYPAEVRPVAGLISSSVTRTDNIVMRRRQHEALALLAADDSLVGDIFLPLRRGLLNGDTTITEYALEATVALDDQRLVPLLKRLDRGVPDWGSSPNYVSPDAAETADAPFEDFVTSDDRTVTAGDVLDELRQG